MPHRILRLAVANLVLLSFFLGCDIRPGGFTFIEYSNMSFTQEGEKFEVFSTGRAIHGNPPAPIYVAFGDDEPVFLPEITEEYCDELIQRHTARLKNPEVAFSRRVNERNENGKRIRTYEPDADGFFEFEDGKLIYCSLAKRHESELGTIRIGRTPDSLTRLDLTKKQIIERFGKPEKIARDGTTQPRSYCVHRINHHRIYRFKNCLKRNQARCSSIR